MTTYRRRLAALEARRSERQPRSLVVMPWDIEPAAAPGDAVMRVAFTRPGDHPSNWVPYARTGIHPGEDDPQSHNGQLHCATAGAQAWTMRTFATGVTIALPYNGREPLEGHPHA
jgi:hypothetical protein